MSETDLVWTAGQEAAVQMVAVGTDGKPWPQPVAAHLQLQRVEMQPVRVQGAGRTIRYRTQTTYSNVLERDLEIQGTTTQSLAAAEAGQYVLEVSATDPHGRKAASSLEFFVSAPEPTRSAAGRLAWNYRDEVRMELKPDRPEYAPGETARLLVEAPFSGVAWVTVERDRVLRSFTTRLEGNAPAIDIPIGRADSPNVFVSVLLARGSGDSPREVKEPEYRLGYCLLPVRDPARRLAVSVVCPATNYLPAQPVEATVNVNDISQRPRGRRGSHALRGGRGHPQPGRPRACPSRRRFSMRRVRWRSIPACPCGTCCRKTPNRAGLPTKATREEAAESMAACAKTSSPARFGTRLWSPARKGRSPPGSRRPIV